MKTVADLKKYLEQFPDTTVLGYKDNDGDCHISWYIGHTTDKLPIYWNGGQVEALILDLE